MSRILIVVLAWALAGLASAAPFSLEGATPQSIAEYQQKLAKQLKGKGYPGLKDKERETVDADIDRLLGLIGGRSNWDQLPAQEGERVVELHRKIVTLVEAGEAPGKTMICRHVATTGSNLRRMQCRSADSRRMKKNHPGYCCGACRRTRAPQIPPGPNR